MIIDFSTQKKAITGTRQLQSILKNRFDINLTITPFVNFEEMKMGNDLVFGFMLEKGEQVLKLGIKLPLNKEQ